MTARKPLTSRDPESIGGHRLIERLGEGGQGVVYLAEDESGDRVALKVLHDRGGSRDAFLKEISAARKVASFCTAEILHAGDDDGLPYVATEFIDGPSLRELVEEKGPQTGPALYRLAIGTATALAAIHQAGIVHRDFKPGNVLVGPDGPRVIDFGVARFLDATVTATSTVIGTPSYMAPEQLAGETVSPAADVFAWGATIAYAANGRPPYGQDTIPAVMTRIVKGKPDLGGLTGPLRDLVAQALHKDASKRPHSRDILLRLLEHSQGPIAAPEALAQGRALAMADDATLTSARTARWATLRFPSEPARRRSPRRPLVLAGAAAAGVIFVAAAAMAVRSGLTDHSGPAAGASDVSSPDSDPPQDRAPASAAPLGVRTPAVRAATSTAVAAAVERAVTGYRTASFSAKGHVGQGDDAFTSRGRLDYRHGAGAHYDMMVRNSYGTGLETASVDARAILIGDCAYLDFAPEICNATNAKTYGDARDRYVWMAEEVRVVTSPEHILALLRNSASLTRSGDSGVNTYRGQTTSNPLAANESMSSFYRQFAGDTTKVSFTLVTDDDNLPKSLIVDIGVKLSPSIVSHSIYSTTYRDWGKGPHINPPG